MLNDNSEKKVYIYIDSSKFLKPLTFCILDNELIQYLNFYILSFD